MAKGNAKKSKQGNGLNLNKLKKALDAAGPLPLRLNVHGSLGEGMHSISIERRGFMGEGESVASVSTTRYVRKSRRSDRFGDDDLKREPIKTAQADAELIVAAVNALPLLLERLGYDGTETGWLLEHAADIYGPVRWYSAKHDQLVIDANLATRFCRSEDAVEMARRLDLKDCKAVEHMWSN